jgi:hypothetical protein
MWQTHIKSSHLTSNSIEVLRTFRPAPLTSVQMPRTQRLAAQLRAVGLLGTSALPPALVPTLAAAGACASTVGFH